MKRYSYKDEQDFILDFFKEKDKGFFLDIGAGDGWNDSNTRALWDLGWSGMLVEANYRAFKQLMEVYGAGERAILLYAAINVVNGPVVFWEHPETGWSSLTPKLLGHPDDYHPRLVQGLRLDALRIPPHIDFMNIDVEGMEAPILNTLPSDMRPTLILAECDKPGADMSVTTTLELRGYRKIWTNGSNAGFVYEASR